MAAYSNLLVESDVQYCTVAGGGCGIGVSDFGGASGGVGGVGNWKNVYGVCGLWLEVQVVTVVGAVVVLRVWKLGRVEVLVRVWSRLERPLDVLFRPVTTFAGRGAVMDARFMRGRVVVERRGGLGTGFEGDPVRWREEVLVRREEMGDSRRFFSGAGIVEE